MSAYFIVNVDISDKVTFGEYMKATPAIIKKHGGKFLVRGGDFEVVEGDWKPKRLVLVEFESMEKALGFYNSPEYQAIINLRQSSAYSEGVFVEGLSKEMFDKVNSF